MNRAALSSQNTFFTESSFEHALFHWCGAGRGGHTGCQHQFGLFQESLREGLFKSCGLTKLLAGGESVFYGAVHYRGSTSEGKSVFHFMRYPWKGEKLTTRKPYNLLFQSPEGGNISISTVRSVYVDGGMPEAEARLRLLCSNSGDRAYWVRMQGPIQFAGVVVALVIAKDGMMEAVAMSESYTGEIFAYAVVANARDELDDVAPLPIDFGHFPSARGCDLKECVPVTVMGSVYVRVANPVGTILPGSVVVAFNGGVKVLDGNGDAASQFVIGTVSPCL